MRWGAHYAVEGASAETFREGYIPPLRLSKKVCLPLGPLCEGAPPAGGGGENCTVAQYISGYGKGLSLRSPSGASATSPVSGESVSQREASLAVCLISVKYHYNNPYYSTHFCVLRFLTNTTL